MRLIAASASTSRGSFVGRSPGGHRQRRPGEAPGRRPPPNSTAGKHLPTFADTAAEGYLTICEGRIDQIGKPEEPSLSAAAPEKPAFNVGVSGDLGVHAENAGPESAAAARVTSERAWRSVDSYSILKEVCQSRRMRSRSLDDVVVEAVEPFAQLCGLQPKRRI